MNKYELLKKFLQNNCNEEEAKTAMQYLESEPWLLDELLTRPEWDEADPSLPIAPTVESEMRKKVFSATSRPLSRMLTPVLVSAAVLSALFVGIWLFSASNNNIADNKSHSAPRILSAVNVITNQTTVIKNLHLDDKSTISLFPGSSVEYAKSFISKRSIKLTGRAIFHVAKNAESPFVVYSGAIRTTALGTRFLVEHSDDRNKVTVKLFEGRVVIQPVENNDLIKKTFLVAGQQCLVDLNKGLVKVESLYTGDPTAQKTPARIYKVNRLSLKEAPQLHFTKTPLPEVLEKLEAAFKTRIGFNHEDIKENYFTGSFSMKDSLSSILKMISIMTELQISQEGSAVRIVKTSPVVRQLKAAVSLNDVKDTGNTIDIGGKIKPLEVALQPDASKNILLDETIVVTESETRYTGISLPVLFEDLQSKTGKKIYFDSEALKKINFTGSLPKDTPLRELLSAICSSNGLTLKVKKGSYFINSTEQ